MSAEHPVYLLDITTGLTRKLIEYLERVAFLLGRPPERKSIFPQDYPFDFPRIRVSVQLSEERLRYDEARLREMDRVAGQRSPETEARLYARRRAEDYEAQAKRKVVQDWEKVRGDIYKPNHKRAVILGDPGFGKSWLLRFEGRQLALAEIDRLKKSSVGTTGVLIPVFARLAKLAEQSGSLIERLEPVLKEDARVNALPHFTELWPLIAKKNDSGQAILLLDGWDEVRLNKDILKQAIESFAEQSPERRIYLTSRIAGYEAISLNAGKTTEWELVSFTQAQVQTFVQSYFHEETEETAKPNGRSEKGAALLHMLGHNVQIMGLGRIPLMLALLCRIAWEKRADEKLPTRRVEIYKDCVWGLVYRWKYGTSKSVIDQDAANATIDLLAELSLSLFLASPHVDAWSLPELKAHMNGLPDSPLGQAERVTGIDQLIKDGILVREGDDERSPLRFIHRTFQEYLAAEAVAKRANAGNGIGWESRCIEVEDIEVKRKRVSARELIDAKSWDPNWQEVICLLAGLLKDVVPLLKLLQEPETDDRLRHRICLLALCLGELKKDRGQTLSHLRHRIAEDIFDLWRSEACLREIDRHLTVAGADNAKLIDALISLLRDEAWGVRSSAARALGDCAQAGADNAKLIDPLIPLLRDEEWGVRHSAARALGNCAQAGADNAKLIDALISLLRDEDGDVRSSAAGVLGNCAQAGADNAKLIDALISLLRDNDGGVRSSAARALGNCAQAGADNAKLIDALIPLLRDEEWGVRSSAAEALGKLGVRVFKKESVHYPRKTVAELSKL